ncbi:hypothetical protein KC345_g323 [Hortaea werneckii]|nr:hypothetical protein KC345_g323 [Hortaea werneckii]
MGLTVPFAPLRSPRDGDSACTISEFLMTDTGLLAPLRNDVGLPAPLRIVDTGLNSCVIFYDRMKDSRKPVERHLDSSGWRLPQEGQAGGVRSCILRFCSTGGIATSPFERLPLTSLFLTPLAFPLTPPGCLDCHAAEPGRGGFAWESLSLRLWLFYRWCLRLAVWLPLSSVDGGAYLSAHSTSPLRKRLQRKHTAGLQLLPRDRSELVEVFEERPRRLWCYEPFCCSVVESRYTTLVLSYGRSRPALARIPPCNQRHKQPKPVTRSSVVLLGIIGSEGLGVIIIVPQAKAAHRRMIGSGLLRYQLRVVRSNTRDAPVQRQKRTVQQPNCSLIVRQIRGLNRVVLIEICLIDLCSYQVSCVLYRCGQADSSSEEMKGQFHRSSRPLLAQHVHRSVYHLPSLATPNKSISDRDKHPGPLDSAGWSERKGPALTRLGYTQYCAYKPPKMPLHLLGKKSWNVYNEENVARVRRDEAAAKAEEEAEEQRMQEEDSARRIALLRGEQPASLSESASVTDAHERTEADQGVKRSRDAGPVVSHGRKRRRLRGEDDTDRDIRYAREDAESNEKVRNALVKTREEEASLRREIMSKSNLKGKTSEKESGRRKKTDTPCVSAMPVVSDRALRSHAARPRGKGRLG